MPRIRQKATEYADKDLRTEVRVQLARLDMSQNEVSAIAAIPKSTLSKRMNDPKSFTLDEFRRLCQAIGLDGAAVLQWFGYGSKDIKKAEEQICQGGDGCPNSF